MNEDITIDLKDLIYRILLRWRIIIAVCLLGAVLADGFGIYRDMKALKAAQSVDPTAQRASAEDELKSLRAELTEREAQEAEAAVDIYEALRIRFNDLTSYQKDSIFYNINSQRVPTVNMLYRVDSHYRVEYPVIEEKDYSDQVARSFIAELENEEFLSSLAASLGTEPRYVEELINAVNADESEESDLSDGFIIKVVGKDEAMCSVIADAVAARMEELKGSLLSGFEGYDLVYVSRVYSEKFDDDVRVQQQQIINDANNMRVNWNSIASPLAEGQKKYYTAAIDLKGEEIIEGESEVSEPEPMPLPTVSYVHKKLILLGFVGAGFMVCFIIAMFYILMPVIRVSENLSEGFSQTVLATVWPEKKSKAFLGGIDDWLTGLFYGRESSYGWKKRVDMLCASLKLMLGKEGIESLYITGASEKTGELTADMVKALGRDVRVLSGESVVYDETSLQKLSDSQAVVFVEAAGDSRYDEITKELELSKQNKVRVLGFVLQQER